MPPVAAEAMFATPLHITRAGYVANYSDQSLSRLIIKQGEATATVRFSQPSLRTQTLSIKLPSAVSLGADAVRYTSIQGTAGMIWSQPDPNMLQLTLPPLLAEAHTSVQIILPVTALQPALLVRISSLPLVSPLSYLCLTLALPLASLLFFLVSIRNQQPRSFAVRATPPDELTPSELGILWHGGLLSQDLSALFLSLAERGLFDIVCHHQDIVLLRRDQGVTGSAEEVELVTLLFPNDSRIITVGARIRALRKQLFSGTVALLFEAAYGKLLAAGLYLEPPQRTHLRIRTIGILLQLSGAVSAIWSFTQYTDVQFAVFFLTALCQYEVGTTLYSVSSRSSLLSIAGIEMRREVSAFIGYLTATKKAVDEMQNFGFYRYLPYAVAVGVTSQLEARFKHTAKQVPSWLSIEEEELVSEGAFTAYATDVANLLSSTIRQLKDPNVG